MPSTITHAYIGVDVLNKLNQKPKNIIKKRINNYKIYCQNMDVLYFYHIMFLKGNKIQNAGHRFHNENVYNCFSTLINDNRKNKDYELFTFIAGLITHYKADSIMHPYIDYLAHNRKKILQVNKHFEIETYIDNYYINKYQTTKYKTYNNGKLIFNHSKEKIVEEEISKLFKIYFNLNDMGKIYYKALNEMSFVFRYIRHDIFGFKKILYSLIDVIPLNIRKTKYLSYHFDLNNDDYYLNLCHNPWFNYKDKTRKSTKSFPDLYTDVVSESSIIINNLYQYIFENKELDLFQLIGNNSYSTGLPISPK